MGGWVDMKVVGRVVVCKVVTLVICLKSITRDEGVGLR